MPAVLLYFVFLICHFLLSNASYYDSFLRPMETKFEVSKDGYLTTCQLVKKHGYGCQNHMITTDDGYIIQIHRITGKKGKPKIPPEAPTIVLMPGLCVSDSLFVLNGPNKSNGLCLADEGFDVWMGNYKGGRYGTKHVNMTFGDKKFFNFGSYEIIAYDYKAIIDYVLKYTKKSKISFAGYSYGGIGTLHFFSLRPEYNEKIQSLYLITTALSLKHTRSNLMRFLGNIFRPFKHEIPMQTMPIMVYTKQSVDQLYASVNNTASLGITFGILESLFGPVGKNYNIRRHLTYSSQQRSGCPMNLYFEATQSIFMDKFHMLDGGESYNLKTYGTKWPRVANLSVITAPTVFFYGENDYLTSPQDVKWTASQMSNVLEVIPMEDYNHGTTVIKEDVKEKITDHIARYIKMLNNIN